MEAVCLLSGEGNIWNTYRILEGYRVRVDHPTGASVNMHSQVWLSSLDLAEKGDPCKAFWGRAASMVYGIYWAETKKENSSAVT